MISIPWDGVNFIECLCLLFELGVLTHFGVIGSPIGVNKIASAKLRTSFKTVDEKLFGYNVFKNCLLLSG